MPSNNRLAATLRERRVVAGPFLNLASAGLAELLGHAGFDFLIVDAEHTSFSMETVESLVRAGDAVGLPTLVRVPANDPVPIMKALDTGTGGVLVPRVNSPEDARRAVEAAKFPPLGDRGACPSVRAAGFQARDWREYQTGANSETVLMLLVESAEALDNAEGLLACQGVDAFLVGPYDLSCSLGRPGEVRHPRVVEAVEAFVAAAVAAGRPVGVHLFQPADSAHWVERGASFFTLSLVTLIAQAARTAVGQVARGVRSSTENV